jgi:hypothetical protein
VTTEQECPEDKASLSFSVSLPLPLSLGLPEWRREMCCESGCAFGGRVDKVNIAILFYLVWGRSRFLKN